MPKQKSEVDNRTKQTTLRPLRGEKTQKNQSTTNKHRKKMRRTFFFFFEFKQTIAQYFPTNQRMRVGLMTTSTSSYQNCKKKSLLVQARDTKQMPIKTHKLVIFLTRQSTVDIK
jgi:hypothetical protein